MKRLILILACCVSVPLCIRAQDSTCRKNDVAGSICMECKDDGVFLYLENDKLCYPLKRAVVEAVLVNNRDEPCETGLEEYAVEHKVNGRWREFPIKWHLGNGGYFAFADVGVIVSPRCSGRFTIKLSQKIFKYKFRRGAYRIKKKIGKYKHASYVYCPFFII